MNTDSPALGIDLGGSKIYAVVTDAGQGVLSTAKQPTPPDADPATLIARMLDTGRQALAALNLGLDDVGCIGAAFPSPVDAETEHCTLASNLGGQNFPAKELFRELCGREVAIGNDGDLGALAEFRSGAGHERENSLIAYFVGTGLGGGIIYRGELMRGKLGMAGELGHMTLRKGGRPCHCGRHGCAEAYCSKWAFVRSILKILRKTGGRLPLPEDKFNKNSTNIKSKYLLQAYQAGDPVVQSVVHKGFFDLGLAAASACAFTAPDRIVLGGGVVSAFGELILPSFRAGFERNLLGLPPEAIALSLSTHGDNAVAIGAALLARSRQRA